MNEIDHLRDLYFAVGRFLTDDAQSDEWFERLRLKYSELSTFYWSKKYVRKNK